MPSGNHQPNLGQGFQILKNTIDMVGRMPHKWDCGGAEIAVPLHRRKDMIIYVKIKKD